MPGPSRTESRWAPIIVTRLPVAGPLGDHVAGALGRRRRCRRRAPPRPFSFSAARPAATDGMSSPGRISEPRGGASLAASATTSPSGARLLRVARLLAERAAAARGDRDAAARAGQLGRAAGEADQRDRRAHAPGPRVAQRLHGQAPPARRQPRLRALAGDRERDLLEPHAVAGRAQPPGDVVDRRVVARRAGRARVRGCAPRSARAPAGARSPPRAATRRAGARACRASSPPARAGPRGPRPLQRVIP